MPHFLKGGLDIFMGRVEGHPVVDVIKLFSEEIYKIYFCAGSGIGSNFIQFLNFVEI